MGDHQVRKKPRELQAAKRNAAARPSGLDLARALACGLELRQLLPPGSRHFLVKGAGSLSPKRNRQPGAKCPAHGHAGVSNSEAWCKQIRGSRTEQAPARPRVKRRVLGETVQSWSQPELFPGHCGPAGHSQDAQLDRVAGRRRKSDSSGERTHLSRPHQPWTGA